MFRLPAFEQLQSANVVLLAGAGGGFDVFSALPLYFALRSRGKQVHLANLSFSNLLPSAGRHVTPDCIEVTADSNGSQTYFPEKHLSQWFRDQGKEVPIYCIHRTGSAPIRRSYEALLAELHFDTVLLVDGGTDSLMRGDESALGTPQEDVASIAALHALPVERKILACLGFGIDAFHGVCHTDVLRAVAELAATGGYLGAISLLEGMDEVHKFRRATEYVMAGTPSRPSIVCTSILSALLGKFGDHHSSERTEGSELFINPLMSIYWFFDLTQVARRIGYLDSIGNTETCIGLSAAIEAYREKLPTVRPATGIPL